MIWLAVGIALAGYFIGDGLKHFGKPDTKSMLEAVEEFDDHELIKEGDVHYFLGMSKEDARAFIQQYPDIPHVNVNGKLYFPKKGLREWLLNLGK